MYNHARYLLCILSFEASVIEKWNSLEEDGTIVQLDPNCEYCQVYIEEQRILL